jgi:hypothetical protein
LLEAFNIMTKMHARLERERRTIAAMIRVYCNNHHDTRDSVCDECAELMAYAEKRLEKCPYQEDKPTCTNCPIHCYKPDRREQVKAIMRYSGPRMMFKHPIFAIRHMIDGYKKAPPRGHRSARRSES